MEIEINPYSRVAVYVQIENFIKFAISAGRIHEGDRLPSVRELSEQLSINPNTIAKSYRDLEVMGYLTTRRGMGVYVAKGAMDRVAKACRRSTAERIFEAVQEGKTAGMSKSEITAVVNASFTADSSPYAGLPKAIHV